MNFTTFKKNLSYLNKTSNTKSEIVSKLLWIYQVYEKLGRKGSKHIFNFFFKKNVGNVKLLVRNNGGSDVFIMSEVFERETYKTTLDAKKPVIVDLGANAGFTAVYFSRVFKGSRIICVEPIPQNIESLKRNILLNSVDAYVYGAAISTSMKKLKMLINDSDYGHKVDNIKFGRDIESNSLEVDGITMQHIIDQQKLDKIDLLKIDIEGYEGILLVENNSWLHIVSKIIMEIHEEVHIDVLKKELGRYNFNNFYESNQNWICTKL